MASEASPKASPSSTASPRSSTCRARPTGCSISTASPTTAFDNLGGNRGAILPEPDVSYRYRLFWEHRELLPDDFRLSVELGFISDRNFLQEYFLREWDELKDEDTRIELKQTRDDWSWSVSSSVRLNDFFTETEWLPRLDHSTIGHSLLGDWLTWYEHSTAGYGQFHVATAPSEANDKPFTYLPWEVNPLVPPGAGHAGEP